MSYKDEQIRKLLNVKAELKSDEFKQIIDNKISTLKAADLVVK